MHVRPVIKGGRRLWRPLQRQHGWLLIQLALVMVVLSLMAARDLVKQFNAVADTKALAVATGLDVIRNAGNEYIASYDDQIQPLAPSASLTVGGVTVSNVSQPTVAELRSLGKAPYGATGKSLIQNGNYRIFITTNPTTCTLPSAP